MKTTEHCEEAQLHPDLYTRCTCMSLFEADGNEDNGADGNTGEEGAQSENSSPEHVVTKPTTVVKVIFSTTKVRHQP